MIPTKNAPAGAPKDADTRAAELARLTQEGLRIEEAEKLLEIPREFRVDKFERLMFKYRFSLRARSCQDWMTAIERASSLGEQQTAINAARGLKFLLSLQRFHQVNSFARQGLWIFHGIYPEERTQGPQQKIIPPRKPRIIIPRHVGPSKKRLSQIQVVPARPLEDAFVLMGK